MALLDRESHKWGVNMTIRAERSKRQRTPSMESLEDRNLLSALAHGPSAAEIESHPGSQFRTLTAKVYGNLANRPVPGDTQNVTVASTSIKGTGLADGVGLIQTNFAHITTFHVKPAPASFAISQGTLIAKTANGSSFTASYSGSGLFLPTLFPTMYQASINGIITGGTGDFAGATGGPIHVQGRGNFATHAFDFTITATVPNVAHHRHR